MTEPEHGGSGNWAGRCDRCGTSHDGHLPGTLAGELRCLRAQAERLGAVHVVHRLDALQRDTAQRDKRTRRHRT